LLVGRATQDVFLHAFTWPSVRENGARLRRRSVEVGPEFELRFDHYLADLDDDDQQQRRARRRRLRDPASQDRRLVRAGGRRSADDKLVRCLGADMVVDRRKDAAAQIRGELPNGDG